VQLTTPPTYGGVFLVALLRVVLGLNLLLLLLLHYGPRSAVIGYILPHLRHFY